MLAIPLISTLYQYGRFTVNDVMQTRAALLGYSVGLLGLIVVKILAPGFYARQVMATPVKIAFTTVLVSQTLAVILMFPMGHAGLTLSTSIGACFNATLLFWFLRKRGYYVPSAGWLALPREARSSRCSCLPACSSCSAVPRRSGSRRRCGRRSDVSPASARRAPPPISLRCGCWASGSPISTGARPHPEVSDAGRSRALTRDANAAPSVRAHALASRQWLPVLRYGQRGFTHSAYR